GRRARVPEARQLLRRLEAALQLAVLQLGGVLGDLPAHVVREACLRRLPLRRHAEPERESATGILHAAAIRFVLALGNLRAVLVHVVDAALLVAGLRRCAPRDGDRKQTSKRKNSSRPDTSSSTHVGTFPLCAIGGRDVYGVDHAVSVVKRK